MKRLVPMVASLALCAAGIAALHAGIASADTPHRPAVVAMLTPRLPLPPAAAPAVDGGKPLPERRPSTAEMASLHEQMCQNDYAHEVGQMAYLEARLELGAAQRPLFNRWKTVRLDIARRDLAYCSTTTLPAPTAGRPTPAEAMAREEEALKRRLADLADERPVLNALYNSLNAGQREALIHPDNFSMGARMMGRHRMAGGIRADAPGPGASPP
jgi:hypothetical protein